MRYGSLVPRVVRSSTSTPRVRLIAAQDQRLAIAGPEAERERGVDAGEQALDRGLLVAATCR